MSTKNLCFCGEIRKVSIWILISYDLEFYSLANTVNLMLSWSVNLLVLFLGRLSPQAS